MISALGLGVDIKSVVVGQGSPRASRSTAKENAGKMPSPSTWMRRGCLYTLVCLNCASRGTSLMTTTIAPARTTTAWMTGLH
jgi:hypothetical protein